MENLVSAKVREFMETERADQTKRKEEQVQLEMQMRELEARLEEYKTMMIEANYLEEDDPRWEAWFETLERMLGEIKEDCREISLLAEIDDTPGHDTTGIDEDDQESSQFLIG